MSTNITISLDKRSKKKDGTYPLVFRLGHNRRTVSIPTGYNLLEKDWDEKKRVVRKGFKGVNSVERLNNQFLKRKTLMLEKVDELRQSNLLDSLSVKELKDQLTRKSNTSSFFVFTEDLIASLRKAQRYGSARNYKTILGVLRGYCDEKGKSDLLFREINYRFLKTFENNHLAKGNSVNSLSVYMRAIRSVYNKAIKEGIAKEAEYPFKEYKIQSSPTKKRAISIEELQTIMNIEFEEDSNLFHYRNFFIASYLLWGISFMDLAFLRYENIMGGRMRYQRKKTSRMYDIKISDQLSKIIEYYSEGEQGPKDFIFPIIRLVSISD